MGIIRDHIGTPAMLEQLAEESAELAHAALKLARIIRNENPTPQNLFTATLNLTEEFTDVYQCAQELRLEPDAQQIKEKTFRFMNRWETTGRGELL